MIAIINYGAGNIKSVCNALEKLEQSYKAVSNLGELACAKKVILPGVGAAGSAMQSLLEAGFIEAIPRLTVPVLGICLGLQLLADFSEENNVECLSVISGRVRKFPGQELKIPQIGWNKVAFKKRSPFLDGIPSGNYFYFVNSYYLDAAEEDVLGETDYGVSFASIVRKSNFYATQFHPEKSGEIGLKLLRNFCEKC